MSNLTKVNRKIKSVKVTSRITKALEVISATQLHFYKDLQEKSLPYLQGIYQIFYEIFQNPEHDIKETNKRLISFQGSKENLWVILGTDIGMVGDLNEKLEKYMASVFNKELDGMILLGNKLLQSLGQRYPENIELSKRSELNLNELVLSVREVAQKAFEIFMSKHYQKLTLVYFKNPKKGIIEKLNILPFTEKYFSNKREVFIRMLNSQVFYPTAVIESFPQYLECIVLGSYIASKVGEYEIRRELMHNAYKNAQELLDEYTLAFNKMRQSKITQELTEIVVASRLNKR